MDTFIFRQPEPNLYLKRVVIIEILFKKWCKIAWANWQILYIYIIPKPECFGHFGRNSLILLLRLIVNNEQIASAMTNLLLVRNFRAPKKKSPKFQPFIITDFVDIPFRDLLHELRNHPSIIKSWGEPRKNPPVRYHHAGWLMTGSL